MKKLLIILTVLITSCSPDYNDVYLCDCNELTYNLEDDLIATKEIKTDCFLDGYTDKYITEKNTYIVIDCNTYKNKRGNTVNTGN